MKEERAVPSLLQAKEIVITDGEGRERKFFISKMPAVQGLEIMARYPASLVSSAIPKIDNWPIVHDLQMKIMSFVAVEINGAPVVLSTQALIDNHTGDWECYAKLLVAEVEYNNRFFRQGIISNFFSDAAKKAWAKISETFIQSSAQLSTQSSQSSGSSEQSTP